ncbi:MAG TPA: nuclear transport factor 2 family protein [Vicinamibacterales bacterium]|nr:nuclear transport factor 2 family protein [Vicinamibacterales bacterium]
MTRDEIAAVLDRWIAAQVASNPSAVPGLYTPDATVISPMFGAFVGHTEIGESYLEAGRLYAGITNMLEARVIENDQAIDVHTVRATHVGEIFGVPPSNRQISFTMVVVFDMRDGRIAQERRLYDFTSVLVQLGVLRARPAHP